jgi:S-adenosylmethionine decarboxylase
MPNKGLGSGSTLKSHGNRKQSSSSSSLKNGRGAPAISMAPSVSTSGGVPAAASVATTTTRSTIYAGAITTTTSTPRYYELRLSLRFILLTVIATAALAFATGRLAVLVLLLRQTTPVDNALYIHVFPNPSPDSHQLPLPLFSDQKEVPRTIYSSKNFDTGVDSTSDSILARRKHSTEPKPAAAKSSSSSSKIDGYVPPQGKELHEPAGQHLLIDIKSVDGAFLNSKDRLAGAMMDLVNMSGLTMLSYHCHALLPVGVSCVGVLLESHISVRSRIGCTADAPILQCDRLRMTGMSHHLVLFVFFISLSSR